MQIESIYEPRVIENFQLAGIAAETIPQGETGNVIEKIFISSLEEHFPLFATNLLSPILGSDPSSSLNSLLVIVKPDNKAYIYQRFPFGIKVIVKKSIEAHRLVSRKMSQILFQFSLKMM